MFSFSDPVRTELAAAARRTWEEVAQPGTWWTAEERLAIAGARRAARCGDAAATSDAPNALPDAAREAAAVVGGDPAHPTEEWVARVTAEISEERYVELVGIVARVVAVDTFTRLLGEDLEPFPEPVAGRPSEERAAGPLRKNRTWVSMGSMAAPPFVLAAVPPPSPP